MNPRETLNKMGISATQYGALITRLSGRYFERRTVYRWNQKPASPMHVAMIQLLSELPADVRSKLFDSVR